MSHQSRVSPRFEGGVVFDLTRTRYAQANQKTVLKLESQEWDVGWLSSKTRHIKKPPEN